jgi:AraC-like DNA-binding protein
VDFEFVSRPAPAALAHCVESIWHARGRIPYRRERIAPTGSTVAGIVLGPPIRQTPLDGDPFLATTGFLIGPHDRPIINEPTGDTWCVGIVATPVGCRAAFGVDPAGLRGRVCDWPPAAHLRSRLTGRTPDEAITLVGAALEPQPVPGLSRVASAVAALEADPTRSIAELAAELGISHGHLDREFLRVVGVGPRVLARTLRVRRLLERIDVYGKVEWTALAGRLGWYDQAHLIRDFKRHTGVTPSEYQAAQRREFAPAEAAPGFVPE